MRIPNNKNFETKRTLELQLWPSADECTLNVMHISRHVYVHVCSRHFVKDGFHSGESGIWSIDVHMLTEINCDQIFVGNSE